MGVFQIRVPSTPNYSVITAKSRNIYYMWRQGNSKNEIVFVTKYESCVFH